MRMAQRLPVSLSVPRGQRERRSRRPVKGFATRSTRRSRSKIPKPEIWRWRTLPGIHSKSRRNSPPRQSNSWPPIVPGNWPFCTTVRSLSWSKVPRLPLHGRLRSGRRKTSLRRRVRLQWFWSQPIRNAPSNSSGRLIQRIVRRKPPPPKSSSAGPSARLPMLPLGLPPCLPVSRAVRASPPWHPSGSVPILRQRCPGWQLSKTRLSARSPRKLARKF